MITLPRTEVSPVLRRSLLLAMVAVLPLHTVFLSAGVSWKPFMVLLAALGVLDLAAGWRERSWPWHPQASVAAALFLAAALASWPAGDVPGRFFKFWLALALGAALLVVVEKGLAEPGALDRVLRVVYWSGAAIGASAVVVALFSVGVFGAGAVERINDLPLVYRVVKPAFLEKGFVAVTNWHQDPGYAAAWGNLWIVLVIGAMARGVGSSRRGVDGLVLGGLAFAVLMTFNRTGTVGMIVAFVIAGVFFVRAGWMDRRRWGRAALSAAVVAGLLLGGLALVDRRGVDGDVDVEVAFRVRQVGALLGLAEPPVSTATGPAAFEGSEERFAVWPEYLDFWRSHPVRGVGLSVGWTTSELTQDPHNIVLELLGETGLLGLLGFLGLVAVVIRYGGGPVGGAALSIAFVAALTQTVLFEPTWWFAAGLLLGGGRRP